jgi:hypothetical protein
MMMDGDNNNVNANDDVNYNYAYFEHVRLASDPLSTLSNAFINMHENQNCCCC